MNQTHDETPAGLRARAARIRNDAWDDVGPSMAQMLRNFADELDAKAEVMTADRCSDARLPC